MVTNERLKNICKTLGSGPLSGDEVTILELARALLAVREKRLFSDGQVRQAVAAAMQASADFTGNPHAAAEEVASRLRGEGEAKVEVRTDHATNEHGDCPDWCKACRANMAQGLNPDGSRP